MIQLHNISLTFFKNYAAGVFHFDKPIVAICGPNGVGKTNLLDAIHFLCLTKSYFSIAESQFVHRGMQGFRIEGAWTRNGQAEQLAVVLRENGKKEMLINQQPYQRFSEHIGKYPCVVIAPDDIELINGPAEVRRKFLDTLLSQLDVDYLQTLITYNKVLQQRNALLRMHHGSHTVSTELLNTYDAQLSEAGDKLFAMRNAFLPDFFKWVDAFYADISSEQEKTAFQYESKLQETSMAELLSQNREKDIYTQRTGQGIHRDDLLLLMNNAPFRNNASQGQKKSLLFALKLAEAEVLHIKKGYVPVLLLDDVFEKLDAQRMHQLLAYVCKKRDGQVFITDTHKERIGKHFETLGVSYQLIELAGDQSL